MLLRKEVWESRVCGSFPFEDVAIKILDLLIPVMELTLTKQEIFVPRTLKYLGRRNCGVSFVLKRVLGILALVYVFVCVCMCNTRTYISKSLLFFKVETLRCHPHT